MSDKYQYLKITSVMEYIYICPLILLLLCLYRVSRGIERVGNSTINLHLPSVFNCYFGFLLF